jgi:hypothetical protein
LCAERELTDADKLFVFERATQGTSGAVKRWAERATKSMTDNELREALEYEIGTYGGYCGPSDPDVEYQSNGLRIWGGWSNVRRTNPPLWSGAATVATARKVYGIKTPEEFREPSLFDFGMSDGDIKTGSSSASA